MEEQDMSQMLEGLIGNLGAMNKSGDVFMPIAKHSTKPLRILLADRITGLLQQDSLTVDQITLLKVLLGGYKQCAP